MNRKQQDAKTEGGWRVLGELMLSGGAAENNAIEPWLRQTLKPLDLNPDLVNRIRLSALQAVERATHSDGEIQNVHIHLRILTASGPLAKGNTWGFFRMEKNDIPVEYLIPKHCVDLHLYLEG